MNSPIRSRDDSKPVTRRPVAETVLREVTDQTQAEQQLRSVNTTLEEQVRLRTAMIEMLHDIASHVHQAVSLEEAVLFILRRVADYNGWSFGHAFVVPPDDADRLVPLKAHYEDPGGTFCEFRKRTGNLSLKRRMGLPGRALESGEPVWARNLPDDLRPERGGILDRLPIQSAAAFPVIVDDRVELVLEFFSTHVIEDDERIRQGMRNVSEHLARTVERLRTVATLRESEQRFRELAESIDQVFWVLDAATDRMLYVSPMWSRIVGMPRSELAEAAQQWWSFLHPDDHARITEEFATKAQQGEFDAVYRIVRSDGEVRWIHDVAVPVQDELGNVRRILGVAEDVTERRELEREVADAATHEQQRLSRDLHDSIGQELTGLTMMASRLEQRLEHSSPEALQAASGLVEGLKRTLQQVRRISRGLAPVDIEAGGLTVALAQLAEQTRLVATTECKFRCERPVMLHDAGVASHMYRIAQEAVANAVKHAQAQTITITLDATDGFCELTIDDDGRGLPSPQNALVEGTGLRIMRYRANLIGARFRVDSTVPGGTRINCRVRHNGHARPSGRARGSSAFGDSPMR